MSQPQVKKHYSEIDAARGIGIILVVLGHTFPDASLAGGVQPHFWRYIFNLIYSFHMPLFVFLSGFVTSKYYVTTKEKTDRIKKRSVRLLIPYIVWGIIYIPLRLMLKSISSTSFSIVDTWKIILGENPYSGLWFLYALFLIDLLRTVFIDTLKKQNIYFGISILALILSKVISFPEPFSWVFAYTFYYILGNIIRNQYCRYKSVLSRKQIVGIELLCLVGLNVLFTRENNVIYRIVSIFTSLLGIFSIVGLSNTVLNNDFLKLCGKYSMDIYILSGPILVALRTFLYYRLHINYSLYVVIGSSIALGLSIVISKHIIRKNRLLTTCLFGG